MSNDNLIVKSGYSLNGTYYGDVEVRPGGQLEILGELFGSLAVGRGASVHIVGAYFGALDLGLDGAVVVDGDLIGPVNISRGASVTVNETGRLSGPTVNAGSLVSRGLRGGGVQGNPPQDLGQILLPTKVVDGVETYEIPPRE